MIRQGYWWRLYRNATSLIRTAVTWVGLDWIGFGWWTPEQEKSSRPPAADQREESEGAEMGLLTNRVERSEINPGDHIYTYRAVFTYSHHGQPFFSFFSWCKSSLSELGFLFFMWLVCAILHLVLHLIGKSLIRFQKICVSHYLLGAGLCVSATCLPIWNAVHEKTPLT